MNATSQTLDDEPSLKSAEVIRVAAFRAALQSFLRRSDLAARHGGLTSQRYLVLLMIKGAPDGSEQTTVSELARRLQLAPNTVSELVSRTEQLGLIRREGSNSDARVAHVRLTEEGERLIARVFSSHDGERRELRDQLDGLEQVDQPDRCEEWIPGRSYTAEQIAERLREANRMLREGTDVVRVCRHLGLSLQTYQRWRAQYRTVGPDDIVRLYQLEHENQRLKQLLAEKELENDELRRRTAPATVVRHSRGRRSA